MFLVPVYLAPSRLHGLGTFASSKIEAGTVVWQFDERIDRIISEETFCELPELVRSYVLEHCMCWPAGGHLLSADLSSFMNHSLHPNLIGPDEFTSVAKDDIEAGEELTENYYEFYLTSPSCKYHREKIYSWESGH